MTEKRHPRHKKLIKAFIKHDGDKQKAYAEAYPNASKTTVRSTAHNTFKAYPLLEKEAVTLLEQSLIKEGMSLPKLAQDLKNIIDNPVVERQTQQGDVIELKDNNLKLKAVSKAFDLHTGPVMGNQPTAGTTNIQININNDTSDKLDDVLSSLGEMSRKMGLSTDAQDGEIIDVEHTSE